MGMKQANTIATLEEYIAWIERTKNDLEANASEPVMFFYRGHGNKAYKLEPSAYRTDKSGNSYKAMQFQLYQDMLRREPEAFRSDSDVFAKLVRMQHHGLPTRLLDLTKNPLVALFFACDSQQKKDGRIFLFHYPSANILFPMDIPGPPLSGLETRLDTEGLLEAITSGFFKKIEHYQNKIDRTAFGCTKFYIKFVEFLNDCVKKINEANNSTLVSKIHALALMEQNLIPEFFDYWNDKLSLCHTKQCYNKEGHSDSKIHLLKFKIFIDEDKDKHLSNIIRNTKFPTHIRYTSYTDFLYQFFMHYFVNPPSNNERIRRQQGAFLLFPPLSGEGILVEDIYDPLSVTIKKEKKEKIIDQLAHLGISRAYLFPELEEQARDIKRCYPPTS